MIVVASAIVGPMGRYLVFCRCTSSEDSPVRKNPAILISGHDLTDLEQLLEQTKGTGVDVYTHSEMLPAHYYPAFKKYDNFAGNYGCMVEAA